jgi:DnaJ-class molecular chaperone
MELKRVVQQIKRSWEASNVVSDCPACKGTGEPTGKYRQWAEPVYWKGVIHWVCHNCQGKGKV